MRFITPLRGVGLGLACAAFAMATPYLPQADRKLKDQDVKKVAKALGDWYETLENKNKGKLEAEADFMEEMAKVSDKKLKGGDLLASLGDMNQVIYMANGYERKAPKRANGSVIEKEVELSRGNIEYAVWTPAKYRPKEGPYTLIITIPEVGKTPENHIKENYVGSEVLDTSIIAAPLMPGEPGEWTTSDAIGAVLLTMREITDVYAIDMSRVFIGGRGKGGETALQFANMFPDRFAGAFCWAGDGGDGVTPENVAHVPILVTGGGANATALEERAKAAGLENVTLDPAGGEAEILAWMAGKSRANYPEKFTIIPGAKFPTRAYWAQFAPTEEMSNMKFEAAVNRETNTIVLTATDITECTLYFSDGVVDLSRPVTVIANGAEPVVDTFQRTPTLFLQYLKDSKSDSGRYYVASKQYSLPIVAADTEK